MTTKDSIKDVLVGKGIKYEDVARSFEQLYSYFTRIQALEKAVKYAPTTGLRGRGNEHADIMIISDVPTEMETKTGYLGFSDYSLYLTIFLNKLGISFDDIYWTSVFKYPTKGISMSAIKKEFPALQAEIHTVCPTIIIALGTTAISALAGEPLKVEKVLGKEMNYNINDALEDVRVIPLLHPSLIIQKETAEFRAHTKTTWRSIKTLADLM